MSNLIKEKQYPDFHHTQLDVHQQMVNTERGYWAGRDPEAEINAKVMKGQGDYTMSYMGALGLLALLYLVIK